MFFDFGTTYNVIIEQYIGNQLVSRQQAAAPKEFLMMQFMGLCEDAARQPQPIRLKMIRLQEIWDDINEESRTLELSMEFCNNAFERG